MVIHHLRSAGDTLRKALEQKDVVAIQAAQVDFSRSVATAWEHYQQGDVTVSVRGLPRVMYQWAVQELPDQIEDPTLWPGIRRELGHFLQTMDLVVEPQELAGEQSGGASVEKE